MYQSVPIKGAPLYRRTLSLGAKFVVLRRSLPWLLEGSPSFLGLLSESSSRTLEWQNVAISQRPVDNLRRTGNQKKTKTLLCCATKLSKVAWVKPTVADVGSTNFLLDRFNTCHALEWVLVQHFVEPFFPIFVVVLPLQME